MSKSVLLIEDTLSLQMVYAAVLRNSGFDVMTASTAQEGWECFQRDRPSTVLLDLMLPDRDGLDLMRDMLEHAPSTCVVVATANGSINRAVQAMRGGAHEFLVKPFDESRMLNAVSNAFADAARRAHDDDPHAPDDTNELNGFIGTSAPMQEVYAKVRSVAQSMASIFISGESGTGKEICAQAVHLNSTRATGPFIPLNCGAIPSELMESEVFGHLKGSFTGAISDKIGAAGAADGGTLFLDEICEMDLALQTKLLRFLQTSTIQPVGAVEPRKVNVRIICATNRDPFEEVRKGRFRQDLFYRLHVIPIHLPPLRERGGDVIEISERLLRRYAEEEGKSFLYLDAEVQRLFRALPWPGNVRQLLNTLRNVVVLHDGPTVMRKMLPEDLLTEADGLTLPPPLAFAPGPIPVEEHPATVAEAAGYGSDESPNLSTALAALRGKTLAEIERIVIEAAIARHGGSVPKAARELEVSPSTLYRKREAWAAALAPSGE